MTGAGKISGSAASQQTLSRLVEIHPGDFLCRQHHEVDCDADRATHEPTDDR
jgi:hypothetical protein